VLFVLCRLTIKCRKNGFIAKSSIILSLPTLHDQSYHDSHHIVLVEVDLLDHLVSMNTKERNIVTCIVGAKGERGYYGFTGMLRSLILLKHTCITGAKGTKGDRGYYGYTGIK